MIRNSVPPLPPPSPPIPMLLLDYAYMCGHTNTNTKHYSFVLKR